MVRERDYVGQTDSADFHAKTGPGSASRPIGAGGPWRATESGSDVCLVLSIRGWWSRLAMRRPIMPALFGEWSDRAVIACVDRVSVVPPRPTSYVARKSCHVMMGARLTIQSAHANEPAGTLGHRHCTNSERTAPPWLIRGAYSGMPEDASGRLHQPTLACPGPGAVAWRPCNVAPVRPLRTDEPMLPDGVPTLNTIAWQPDQRATAADRSRSCRSRSG